jgi:hypothetical protein
MQKMSKTPLPIEFCCVAKKHRMQQIIEYSSAMVFAAATVDELEVAACNDVIAIVAGHAERCGLPLLIDLVLQFKCAKRKCAKQLANTRQKESRVFFCPLFYGVPVQKLHNFQSYPVLRSQTRLFLMCGFMF